MTKRRDLPQPFLLPGSISGSFFQSHEPFPTEDLEKKWPASTLGQDPLSISGREESRSTGNQRLRLGYRKRAEGRSIAKDIEERRTQMTMMRQLRKRGARGQYKPQVACDVMLG